VPDPPTFIHDAFISYSRRDTRFAAALERALKRYRPPKGLSAPPRRLNVFRDQEDFTGVEYSEAVARHLRGARRLVVVCSPHARQSEYVNDEVRLFAESHAATDIVSVIIAGVPNNEAPPGHEAAAFPAALCERLAVPLASDYRGFDARWHGPGSRRFRGAWYKLLADVLGCSRAEVEERERRRRLRQRLGWGGTSVVVTAVLALALYMAGARGRTARSNELAGQAMSVVRSDPELATLLALEAANQMDTPAAVSALRVALAQLPDLQIVVAPGADLSTPRAIAFAPDGRRMAIADPRAKPRVVDVETGTVSELGPDRAAPVEKLAWSPDGALIAAVDEEGHTVVYDAATDKRVAEADGELHWRSAPGKSGVSAVILRGGTVHVVELERSGAWRTLGEAPNPGGSLSPDARRLATLADDTRRLTITDLESGQVTSRVLDGPTDGGLFWSPKGGYLVAHALFGFVVVDARTLASTFSLEANEIIVEDLSVSPDETRLAGTDRGGSTSLWDIKAREKVTELSGQETRAYRPVFSSDGKLLSVIYANGRAELFETNGAARTPLTTFDAIAGDIVATDFTPDGRALLVQYEKGRVALWLTDRWHPEHRLPLDYGDKQRLDNVRVTADGSVVAVQKGQAWRGWSTVSGAEVLEFDRAASLPSLPTGVEKSQLHRLSHEADVLSERISRDGACILTASAYRMASGGAPANANVVRLWDAGSATLLRQWHFDGLGPDGAFFAGHDRVVALYQGEGYVYRTSLCEPLGVLRELAGKRVPRGLTPEERSAYLGEPAPPAPFANE
jgi:WD40 repeat protein